MTKNSAIDFDLLYNETAGYAVHCRTKEQAVEFVDTARSLYPKMCSDWGRGEYHYATHEENTIYTFDRSIRHGWQKAKLMFGSVSEARRMGYTVIEFDEICNVPEIEESDVPIEFLMS